MKSSSWYTYWLTANLSSPDLSHWPSWDQHFAYLNYLLEKLVPHLHFLKNLLGWLRLEVVLAVLDWNVKAGLLVAVHLRLLLEVLKVAPDEVVDKERL